jgi:hypothetical protein
MTQTELVDKPDVTISESACKHHFGFLNQRAKGVATPEECFTCEKMLDCMVSKPDGTTPATEFVEPTQEMEAVEEIAEKVEEPSAEPAGLAETTEAEPESVIVVEEVEEPTVTDKPKTAINDVPKIFKEQVSKRIGQILKQRIPKLGIQVKTAQPTERTDVAKPGEDFCVEGSGTLFNQWSGTVLINKDTLESWGKKIKEVELETQKGRITICKVHPVAGLALQVIQVPAKIKMILCIDDGARVKVKPIQN